MNPRQSTKALADRNQLDHNQSMIIENQESKNHFNDSHHHSSLVKINSRPRLSNENSQSPKREPRMQPLASIDESTYTQKEILGQSAVESPYHEEGKD